MHVCMQVCMHGCTCMYNFISTARSYTNWNPMVGKLFTRIRSIYHSILAWNSFINDTFCWKSTGDRWITHTNCQKCGKRFNITISLWSWHPDNTVFSEQKIDWMEGWKCRMDGWTHTDLSDIHNVSPDRWGPAPWLPNHPAVELWWDPLASWLSPPWPCLGLLCSPPGACPNDLQRQGRIFKNV